MRLGVISDTHDYTDFTAQAVEQMRLLGAEEILHCGDIDTPRIVELFRGTPTHFVFGNWDADSAGLMAAIADTGNFFYEDFGFLERDGKRIAWLHSHVRGHLRELEKWREFDYIFYGHTHRREAHQAGKCWVVNPGAMYRAKPRSCLVIDLETAVIDWVEFE